LKRYWYAKRKIKYIFAVSKIINNFAFNHWQIIFYSIVINMKNLKSGLYLLAVCLLVVLGGVACGDDSKDDLIANETTSNTNGGDTLSDYTKAKEKERIAISNFIMDRGISIISEKQFLERNYTTDVQKNEYVYLAESGVYLQIVRKGHACASSNVVPFYYEIAYTQLLEK
jgi:hypothetical protein